jgi:hypothetical protein
MKRLIGVKELRALMEEPKPIHEKVDTINKLAKDWMESEMQILIKHYINK